MTFQKQWAAHCDAEGCDESWIYPGAASQDRWDVGMALNDEGWQAGPGMDKCYCPKHRTDDAEWL